MTSTIKVHVLHCGQVQVDIAVPFKQKTLNPLAFTGLFRSSKHQIVIPVSAYLIEHPKGLVLVDTGWHTDVRGDQAKYLGKISYRISKAFLPEGQAVHEQLLKMGIKAKDLDYVVISHMDADHASGIKLLNEAKNMMTSDMEWQATVKNKLRYKQHMWEGIEIKPFSMTDSEYGPMRKSFDLFNDESIVFVHTPGHSHGMVSTIVQNNGKFVLLANDTGYSKESWEEMILPGIVVNKKHAFESLKWVKNMSLKSNCIEALANHDPEILPHVIEL
ncbi:N-acyl homoserine lactonase family protein [Paenibacillus glycanilyticus]|uniref:MBL fold hydrolase n=1 Tax=Paenibacillus glycanilyticus TaxID=126569 RepID=A0ABQ6GJC7_9BACL|nr:N-acyl homoserine lactonase family protein [Paenibacillus glycanilyticus]GLX69726.1 MBL fold hydrolase [Paenibacillus glycanilyticus]